MDEELLDFSALKIREVPIVTPDGRHLTLKEATGKAVTEYRNASMAASRFGPDGRVQSIVGLASVEAALVAACLWDDKGKNLHPSVVGSWPSRVQKKLFETVKEISGLNEDSPLQVALEAALNREDSPVTLQDFVAWVVTLPRERDDDTRAIVIMFEDHELLKNLQSATTNGSS